MPAADPRNPLPCLQDPEWLVSATQNCAGLTSAARDPSKLGGPSHSCHRWPRRDRLGDRVPRCRADPRSTEHSTTSWCPAAQRPGQDSGLMCRRRVWLAEGPCPASLAPAAGARAERENDCPARGWLCGAGKATWSEEEKVGEEAETYVTVALGTCAARDSPEDRSHTREDGAVLGTPFLVPKRIHTGSQRVPQQPRRVSCEWSRKLPDHRAQQRLGDGALRPPPPPWKAPGASGSGLLALPAQDCGPAAGLLRREHFLCKRRRGPRPCPRPGVPNGAAVRARAVPWEPPPADRAWTADRRGSAPLAPRSARTGGACGLAGVHRGAGRKPGLQPARRGPGSAGREGLQGASGRTLLNPRPCLGSRRCLPSVAREFQRW